jgi:predicted HicB family RNase H-like nuclease
MATPTINFPLRLPEEIHILLSEMAYKAKKTKNQYCIDAIKKVAEKDSKNN